jgi:hypothetical protein
VVRLLWGFNLSASIRNCTAAYASSACLAHVSPRAAIWLHVVFSSPRLELAMRPHSAALAPKFFRWIHCGTSSKEPTSLRVKFKVASQFQHSLKKDMLRRSNVATSLANSTCQCR